jgi:hypothetical protein
MGNILNLIKGGKQAQDAYIYDAIGYEPSHREKDDNGRLIVKHTLITKGCVSPYWGEEIPNWQELGLDPKKKYNVYRPIEELKNAKWAPTMPLLNKHIMDYADMPQRENWAGSVSNFDFEGDNVYADICFWNNEDIDNVENGTKKDLSMGYRCKHIKESGEYNGQPYDLKMVNILPNHLALVEKGRVKGAYVFDEEKQKGEMTMIKKLAAMFDSFSKELEKQADEFRESDHPRADDGKFTSGGGSTGGAKKETKSAKTTQSKVEHYPYRESRDLIANAKKVDGKILSHTGNGLFEITHYTNHGGTNGISIKTKPVDENDDLWDKYENADDDAKLYLLPEAVEKDGGQGDADPEKESKMTEEKKVCDAEHEDKRQLIDEIGGMLKGKVDEELWRTIIGKAEKLAYEGSEKSEADDELKEEHKEEVKAEEVKKDEDIKAKEEKEEVDLQKIKDEAKEEAKKEMEELIKAKEEVEDVAGKCAVQDSAAKYYKIGLEAMGISCKGVMDEDLRGMFRGAVAKNAKSVVMDGAAKQDAINEALGKCNLPKRVY